MKWIEVRRRAPGFSAIYVVLFWTIVRFFVWLFARVFYGAQCRGMENVPKSGPAIFAANHQSHYDPPFIGAFVGDRPLSYVARSGLFRFKPFAWLISLLGAIPIRQGEGDTSAVRRTLAELEAGRCVLIFPEGGRSRDGSVMKFHRGLSLLMKRSKAPVVPVAIEGLYDIWPAGRMFPRLFGHYRVVVGKPINSAELLEQGEREALEDLRKQIDSMRLELRKELREYTSGKYPAPSAGDQPDTESE